MEQIRLENMHVYEAKDWSLVFDDLNNNKIKKMKVTKENFKPVGQLVFVKPLSKRYKTVTQMKPIPTSNIDEVTELEEVKEKVFYNQQLAEVLAIGSGLSNAAYNVGDIIVYDLGQVRDLDLIRGTAIIGDYSIIGIIG